MNRRVRCYVDGFNLYHGLVADGLRKSKWLDVQALAARFLKPDQTLEHTVFFTSMIRNDPSKERRQISYIEALIAVGVEVVYGNYQFDEAVCRRCQNRWPTPHEKMTDVNIATRLLTDAFQGSYEVAILISGDNDLTPAVQAVRKLFPTKQVVVAFPPRRQGYHLQRAASASFTIGRHRIEQSQLPETITKADGYVLRRPPEWT